MVMPNLIHPVPVTIEVLDQVRQEDNAGDGSWFDDDFREPVQQAAREINVIVDGQIMWDLTKELQASRAGAIQDSSGYVLFRYVDLEAKSIVLKVNDRFLKLGKIDSDVYVTALRPNAHYTDQGGATMVKAFFKDRQPSKQGAA